MSKVRLIDGGLGDPVMIDREGCVLVGRGREGVALYGPYEERPPGDYRVGIRLGLADGERPRGNAICAVIDIVTNDGQSLIAKRHLLFSHLDTGLDAIELPFTLHEPRVLEYRIHSTGQAALTISTAVEVELVHAPPGKDVRGSRERAWENEREFLDGYLRNISGVIHVGANLGQERRYYWLLGVDVLWVEPIREIYERMVDNVARYPRQRPVFALLGARDGEEVSLGIASNNGASSSILPLEDHKALFPDIDYIEQRKLTTCTLGSMLRREDVDIEAYQALTIDTEGAELMILRGAGALLKHFQYIKCEVADFPARTGTPSTEDIDGLLRPLGFRELARRRFGMGPGGNGTFWDIVWKREEPGEP